MHNKHQGDMVLEVEQKEQCFLFHWKPREDDGLQKLPVVQDTVLSLRLWDMARAVHRVTACNTVS